MSLTIPRKQLSVQSNLWLLIDGESLGGAGRFELLQLIDRTGSIRQAAIAMGMSYRAAWGAVEVMNQRLGIPLVLRLTGGVGGGGATLSPAGHTLLKAWQQLQTVHTRQTVQLNARLAKLMVAARAKVPKPPLSPRASSKKAR